MNQRAAILDHLQRGRTLTPLEALKLYGCMRLAARIQELRQQGHDIASERHELAREKVVCRYRLRQPAQTELNLR